MMRQSHSATIHKVSRRRAPDIDCSAEVVRSRLSLHLSADLMTHCHNLGPPPLCRRHPPAHSHSPPDLDTASLSNASRRLP